MIRQLNFSLQVQINHTWSHKKSLNLIAQRLYKRTRKRSGPCLKKAGKGGDLFFKCDMKEMAPPKNKKGTIA